MTYLNHDSKGHPERQVDGTEGGAFDLQFTYDFAERLVKVEDLTGTTRRTLKTFTYAGQNSPAGCTPDAAGCNATRGKLVTPCATTRSTPSARSR